MTTSSGGVRSGVGAVFQTLSVTVATVLFAPGVLVRVAMLHLAARSTGARCEVRDLSLELGGTVRSVSGPIRWIRMFVVTTGGCVAVAVALLLPAAIRFAFLDVRPLAALPGNPSALFGRSTPFFLVLDVPLRFGYAEAMRLWFGVSCLYCCIPPSEVLEGAASEARGLRPFSPVSLALRPFLAMCRLLRAIDAMLTFGLAESFLASGLLVTAMVWVVLTRVLALAI